MNRLRELSKNIPQAANGDNSAVAQKQLFEPPKESPIENITLEDVGDYLKMCRVDKGGYLVNVPDDRVGHFYAGDSYVIFCKYKTVSGEVGLSTYIWHGFMSPMKTEDDAIHRAIKASCSTLSTVQVKITQGNEPSYFRSMFYEHCPSHIPTKSIIVHNGGSHCGKYDCANYKIINKPYNVGDNCIYHVQIQNNHISTAYVIGKPKLSSSLNSQDCFILLNEGMALLWIGKECSEEDRAIAHYMAGLVSGDPLAVLKMVENQNEMEEFWIALGGKDVYPSMRDVNRREGMTAEESELFIAEGWEWKSAGKDYSTADLVSSNILVLDAGFEGTFVWVGSEKNESTGMFYKAVECLDSIDAKDSETRPIVVVNQRFENNLFKQTFKGFESVNSADLSHVNGTVSAEIEEQQSNMENKSENDTVQEEESKVTNQEKKAAQHLANHEEIRVISADITPSVQVGDRVKSIYGEGIIKEVRVKGEVVVEMTTWKLAGGQKPTAYLQMNYYQRLNGSDDISVGDPVKSIYGYGVTKEVRTDAVVIELTSWELAGGQRPTAYLQVANYEKINVTAMQDGDEVTAKMAVEAAATVKKAEQEKQVTTEEAEEAAKQAEQEKLAAEEEEATAVAAEKAEQVKVAAETAAAKKVEDEEKAAEEEAAAAKKVEQEKVAAEEAEEKKATEAAAAKKAEEEEKAAAAAAAAAKKVEDEKIAAEETAEAAAKKAKEEEEAAEQEGVEAKKKAEDEKLAAEAAAKKAKEEEKAAEEEAAVAKKKAEDEKLAAEAAAKKAEEEKLAAEEEEAAAKKAEEEKQAAEEEEAAAKKAEAEKQAAEEDEAAATKKAEEEKLAAEEAAAAAAAKKVQKEKKAAEEEAAAKKAEEEKKAAEEAAAAAAAKKAEEEKQAAEEEEAAAKKAEAEKQAAEEEAAAAAKKAEEEKHAAEEEKKAAEEEAAAAAAKKAEEEKQVAEEAAAAKKAEEEKQAAEAAAAAAKMAIEEKLETEEVEAKKIEEKVEAEQKVVDAVKKVEEDDLAAEKATAKMAEGLSVEEKTTDMTQNGYSSNEADIKTEIQHIETPSRSPPKDPEESVEIESSKQSKMKEQEELTKQYVPSTTTDSDQKFYTLEELKKPIDSVEWSRREHFLSDDDFMTYFGMDKSKFASLALWKRQSAKRKLGIF